MQKIQHQESNTTHHSRVSDVQSDVMKLKGLYISMTVPIYERCSALRKENCNS